MPIDSPLSLPADAPRVAALLAAIAALVAVPRLLRARRVRWAWLVAPAAAAALSAGYIAYYLRGGPRIIDATAYWLQARALSEGMLAFPVSEPEQAILGRFLLRTEIDGSAAASVIFPPGYPAVLAIGFVLKAPLAVGPAIAAALVVATMDLTRRIARLCFAEAEAPLVHLAAVLSVLCATLRYHTADTMSHGLAALCMTIALTATLRLAQRSELRAQLQSAAMLGLAGGALFATRPASALALALAVLFAAFMLPKLRRLRPWALMTVALAATPPLWLWLAHQYAATGELTSTAQSAYYALSDGPPGCFRYGFGEGIGCLGEHGNFVRQRLPEGYGLVAALGTTGRRLALHLSDPISFAPLFALVPLGAYHGRRFAAVRVLSVAVVAQMVCYAPFYFDGNYPGGGARMYADVLPLEHVLAVLGLLALARRWPLPRAAAAVAATSLLGFALHSGGYHAQLRDREGGRPMFEPEVVEKVRGAIVFVDTDHGFNLGFDPRASASRHAVRVVRHRGDDLDRLAWESAGRPPAYRYRFPFGEHDARARLEPRTFQEASQLTIEAESLWPPATQSGGWIWPSFSASTCVSRGRLLALRPTNSVSNATLRLPSAALAGRSIGVVVVVDDHEASAMPKKNRAIIGIYNDGEEIHSWEIAGRADAGCAELAAVALPQRPGTLTLRLAAGRPIAIDLLKIGEKR